jgi:hypothetical protein
MRIDRVRALAAGLFPLVALACSGQPTAPQQPTWADVSPIMRGECAGCHGSTADKTGLGYRLDFYDMTADTCGQAAQAMGAGSILAGSAATRIGFDVTPMGDSGRPRMPPLPGSPLPDWERETLVRWAAQPVKGAPPADNHAPTIVLARQPAVADNQVAFTAIVDDADGEAVVGTIAFGDLRFLMNRSGSFAVSFDTTGWPDGSQRLTAVLCDGWESVSYDLGPVQIAHAAQ